MNNTAAHSSPEIANGNLEKFYNEISELAKKYNFNDYMVIVHSNVQYNDGTDGTFLHLKAQSDCGRAIAMAAFAYGKLSAEHRKHINNLMAG